MQLTAYCSAGTGNSVPKTALALFTPKILCVMRLTAILLLAASLQVAARSGAQTVNLNARGTSLEKVFADIRKQTGYEFVYQTKVLAKARPVTLSVSRMALPEVLARLFKDQPLAYQLIEKTIVVTEKEEPHIKQQEEALPPPIDIKGRVTNENGEPVVATIMIKGTTRGTSTNEQGYFELKGVDANAVLVISGVGIETREVPVSGRTELAIAAIAKVTSLQEVVINKGYYTEKQKYSVGNVGRVTAKDIEKQPVSNPLLALQGRVPGLFITQATGLPGSGVTVRIQGINSIARGNDPLYIIDGVPYVSQLLPTLSGIQGSSGGITVSGVGAGSGNPLNFLNPADVESIEVLKDADATAIYGSRGANGVILITTKKGKAGETRVDLNIRTGWGEITRKLALLNTQEYLQMRREALNNDNLLVAPTDYDINGFWDTTSNKDWQNELLGGTSRYTDVQTNFSGGSLLTQYILGMGYHKETTVFPGDLFNQKASLHFSINNKSSNEKFRINFSGHYMHDENRLAQVDHTLSAITLAPTAPSVYNTDGGLNWMPDASGNSTWSNPLADLMRGYRNRVENFIGNGLLAYQLSKAFELKLSGGYSRLQSNELSTTPLTAYRPEERHFSTRSADYANGLVTTWLLEPQAIFRRSTRKDKFEFLVGTTFQTTSSSRNQFSGSGYIDDAVMEDIKAAASLTIGNTILSEYKYNALFGRINYELMGKYLVNLTARRDGSSRFGDKNLFHQFGSAGIAWIFSDETIFKENLGFINFGKLRASYGTTGNDQIGDYQFLNLYSIQSGIGITYQGASGLQPNGITNPFLQWEETRKFQTGLDFGVYNDRLSFTINYVRNRSSNQLLSVALPAMTGFNSINAVNFPATVQNTAWECLINVAVMRKKNVIWSTSLNLTVPKNKLIKFPNLETSTYASRLIIGQPINIVKTFDFAGIDPNTGLFQFKDKNGGVTSNPHSIDDKYFAVNTAPQFYGGLLNNIKFKSFECDFLFQVVKQTGSNYLFGFVPGYFNINQPKTVLDRWQKPGDISFNQKYNSNFNLYTSFNQASTSNAAYSDASFIRLKNFSFSWHLPKSINPPKHIKSFKVFIHAQNLLTFTKYKGLDPENRSTVSLPLLRVVTTGLQVSF